MTTLYLYDTHGYYVGLCEGVAAHSNSTPIKPVDDTPQVRQRFVDGVWIGVAQTTETGSIAVERKVSPVEFKLLFTAQERVAIKASVDPVVQDFFEIVNDPRLTFVNLDLASTRAAIAYLEHLGIIDHERAMNILAGVIE